MNTEFLGICIDSGLSYEGSFTTGHRIQPAPMLLPLQFVENETVEAPGLVGGYPKQIFREDSFDPITRIRRGRVYTWHSHEHQWFVQDPFRSDLREKSWNRGCAKIINAMVYQKDPLSGLALKPHLKVQLGDDHGSSIWKILLRETSIHGSQILTLKSYRSLGEIPDLALNEIPPEVLPALTAELERVERSANRMSPDDVVDRCRNALTIIYGALGGNRANDLDRAIKHYLAKFQKKEVVANAGHIVKRLHSRGKACEQYSKDLRPLSEEDAQLALRCLGFVLIETGWASPTY